MHSHVFRKTAYLLVGLNEKYMGRFDHLEANYGAIAPGRINLLAHGLRLATGCELSTDYTVKNTFPWDLNLFRRL